jgi:hypothetical protein
MRFMQLSSSSKTAIQKINHPLGFVMFMQLSSSSKTAIQKNQSFFGVCEVCAQLSSSKTAIQKNQLFFGVCEVNAKEGRKVPLTTLSVPFSRHKSRAFFVDSGFVIISTTIPKLMGACYSRKQ